MDTLKASLAELAHVKLEDLRHVVPPRPRSSLRWLLPTGAGVFLAAAAVAAFRWRTSS
jgi:hypothetical protein